MALKVGFIGVGGIAQAHMPNVQVHKDTRITAVCDVNEARAKEVAQKLGAKAYTSYTTMLRNQLDAVYVCLPPAAHGKIELDLARRGIPFCVEKPVHIDVKKATAVARVVKEKNLVTSVGYQVRYAPQVDRAAEFLRSRRITLVEGWFVGGMPGTPWWRQKAVSGGQALEQTTHIFDLARLLAGEVEEVCAYGSVGAMTDIENYDIEDATVALLKFKSGAVGHICSACVLNKGGARHVGLRFDGRDYSVELTYGSLTLHTEAGKDEQQYPNALGPAMAQLDHAFLNAVETGDRSGIRCDYEGGVRSAAISIALNKSLETGKPVSPQKLIEKAGGM
jgi:myo-inositol 2-dehydrogenase/D-chiro-inositol 1-dehydrogenase